MYTVVELTLMAVVTVVSVEAAVWAGWGLLRAILFFLQKDSAPAKSL
ncbi:MAG: hypothetical protein AB1898_02850 [Acidobacteriota bacterium]